MSLEDLNISSMEDASAEIARLLRLVDEKDEEISNLEDKVDELTDDYEFLEEEIMEYQIPSSRRPPPHFKLPPERPSLTHKFRIGQSNLGRGYLTVSYYPDSTDVGELFIKIRKEADPAIPDHLKEDAYVSRLHQDVSDLSAFLRGVLDQLAIAVSIGLQRGIPLETYAKKYKSTRFPPDGMTSNPDISYATSIVDYLFRYLGIKFIGTEEWLPRNKDS